MSESAGSAPPSAAPSAASVAEEQRSGTATGSGGKLIYLVKDL